MQGYSPKIPLSTDVIDGAYTLIKTKTESIKQDLKMLVLTSPGERVMLPTYGVGIKRYLFSQFTDEIEDNIRSAILDQVKRYMGFITIKEIEINKNEDYNSLNISINFFIPSLKSEDQLIFSIDSN